MICLNYLNDYRIESSVGSRQNAITEAKLDVVGESVTQGEATSLGRCWQLMTVAWISN